jgi:hypothetical protein
MGYRSDVTAAFYAAQEKDFGALKVWIASNFPVNEFAKNIRWFNRGMVVEMQFVKWYDEFKDVQAFNAAVSKFRTFIEEHPKLGLAYEYARVGESQDDIETEAEGECEWLVNIQRAITVEV